MSLGFLHGINSAEVIDSGRPVITVKAGVIGLVGTAGKGPVNEATLIVGNDRQGVDLFGADLNDGFSIPGALKAIFDQVGATVVVVNVAVRDTNDIDNLQTDISNEAVVLDGNIGKLAHGYASAVHLDSTFRAPYIATADATITLPAGATRTGIRNAADTADVTLGNVVEGETYIVLYTATAVSPTDYTINTESGQVTRAVSGSKLLPNTTMSFDYSYVDPTLGESSLIVGGVKQDGTFTGIEELRSALSKVFVKPRILIAPQFSQIRPDDFTASAVGTALHDMAARLRGVCVLDTPNTTKEAAVAYANDFDGDSRAYVHYPYHRILNPDGDGTIIASPASARIAGVIAKVFNDPSEGFWVSPSNHTIAGILGLDKPVDWAQGDSETVANYLNDPTDHAPVATTVQSLGFRLWGNRVCDGTFLSGRVIADQVEEAIAAYIAAAVDRNITKGFVEWVVTNVNDYIRVLTSQGAILGGRAWADPTLNTPTVLAAGKLFIDYDLTRPTPAENITLTAHFVNTYLATIFDANA